MAHASLPKADFLPPCLRLKLKVGNNGQVNCTHARTGCCFCSCCCCICCSTQGHLMLVDSHADTHVTHLLLETHLTHTLCSCQLHCTAALTDWGQHGRLVKPSEDPTVYQPLTDHRAWTSTETFLHTLHTNAQLPFPIPHHHQSKPKSPTRCTQHQVLQQQQREGVT